MTAAFFHASIRSPLDRSVVTFEIEKNRWERAGLAAITAKEQLNAKRTATILEFRSRKLSAVTRITDTKMPTQELLVPLPMAPRTMRTAATRSPFLWEIFSAFCSQRIMLAGKTVATILA